MGYNFTLEDIKRVILEISELLAGSRIQNVYQPSKDDIYIEIYKKGQTDYLLISTENGFNRLYLTSNRPLSPLNPFSFQMLLRKYIVPSYINEIVQVNQDRVVMLSAGEYKLYAELTGRHSNIFLTDVNDIILGSLKENKSQKRPLFVSLPYIPPFKKEFSNKSPFSIPEQTSPSRFYSDTYEKLIGQHRLESLKRRVLRYLTEQERHLRYIITKIDSDLNRASRYKEFLQYAEALKQNKILSISDNQALCEYYTDKGLCNISVPLIKGGDISSNREYYFKMYKKYKNSIELIKNRRMEIENNLNEILKKKEIVEMADDITLLSNLLPEKEGENLNIRIERSDNIKKYPFRVFFVEGIGKIYSGSNAEENEILTFKYARGNDLWFHVIGYSGSHTVLPLERGKVPDERQIVTAAKIAAARSSAPDGELVEVAYTRVKYVRKVRGEAKGSVIFSNEKRLFIRVDRSFLSSIIKIS